MTPLNTIPGIGKSALELLEVAGFQDVESFATADEEEVMMELNRANSILKIAKRPPSAANITKWITAAREMAHQYPGAETETESTTDAPAVIDSEAEAEAEVTQIINYEEMEDVIVMLEAAPFAIPLPAKLLKEQQLAVSDIPPAILLNQYPGDLNVRTDKRIRNTSSSPATPPRNESIKISESAPSKIIIDHSKIKPVGEVEDGEVKSLRRSKSEDSERVALIRGPRKETNAGRDRRSRWYIHGVLHNSPFTLVLGAITTLLLVMMVPLALATAGLLLLSDTVPVSFDWVPKWLLIFPLALPVFGLIYLICGFRGSCRVCGQKLFVPRMCLKNPKAHHVALIGYIIPLSLHLLIFKWFRCTYCGTPVRLKK